MDSVDGTVFDEHVQPGVAPEGEGAFELPVGLFGKALGHPCKGIVLDRPGVTFR